MFVKFDKKGINDLLCLYILMVKLINNSIVATKVGENVPKRYTSQCKSFIWHVIHLPLSPFLLSGRSRGIFVVSLFRRLTRLTYESILRPWRWVNSELHGHLSTKTWCGRALGLPLHACWFSKQLGKGVWRRKRVRSWSRNFACGFFGNPLTKNLDPPLLFSHSLPHHPLHSHIVSF